MKLRSLFPHGSIGVFLSILMLATLACTAVTGLFQSADSNATPTSEAPEEVDAPDTESAPELDDETRDQWQTVIGLSSSLSGICEDVIAIAEQEDNDELESDEAHSELRQIHSLYQAVEADLTAWDSKDDFADYGQSLSRLSAEMQAIVDGWLDRVLEAGQVVGSLPSICQDLEDLQSEILDEASNAGVDDADLAAWQEPVEAPEEDETEQEVPTQQAQAESTQNPELAEPGRSRINPIPAGEWLIGPGWEIRVLELVRGDEAAQMIRQANSFNARPPDGYEFVSLRLQVKCTYEDDEEHNVSGAYFSVTGENLIRHPRAGIVNPEPPLRGDLFSGGELEGWETFLIDEGEEGLILISDIFINEETPPIRYLALDSGASYQIPADLASIRPDDLGLNRSDPAPLGETIVSDNWEMTVLESLRGDEALALLEDYYSEVDPLETDEEYIATRLHVRYIGQNPYSDTITHYEFTATGDENVVYESIFKAPWPSLDRNLFPGGETEGWIVQVVGAGETGLMLIFDDYNESGARYLDLAE